MNKLIISVLLMVGLVGMIGTAAAEPHYIFIYEDGTTSLVSNPSPIQNDGSDFLMDIYNCGYYNNTIGLSHTMTITVTPLDGNTLANGEIFIQGIEKDTGAVAETNTSDGTNNVLTIVINWDQDNDGLGGSTAIGDTIDFTIRSTGPLDRDYELGFADDGYSYESTGLYTDSGSEEVVVDNIPEFPTVALPIAAVLGLMFIISSRKKKE